MKRSTIVIAALVAAGLLTGCRGEEERPMVLGDGAYIGGGVTPLTVEQVSALNSRAKMQGESNTAASRGPSVSTTPGPAAAVQPTANETVLNQRLRQQQ